MGFRYDKVTTGIEIASETTIDRIRERCPAFNQWIKEIEGLRI